MNTQSTIKMLTPFDVPVQKSIFDIIFVLPVLVRENQLQIFDKAGDVFICHTDAFEEKVYQTKDHELDNLGDSVWIDRTFWSDGNRHENTFRALYGMGGIAALPPNDILLVVQKGQVLTIFTQDGLYYKPAITAISVLCPAHAYNRKGNMGWRKGMDPQEIPNRVFEKGMTIKVK